MLTENYRWFEPHGFSLGDEALGWLERELGGDAPLDGWPHGGETLRLGSDQRWEVLALPGHTAGHIGLWHAGDRIALVIDAVLGNGIRDRAGNLLIPPRIYDLPSYRRTISALRELSPELLLTAHHPLMDRTAAAEFLNVQGHRGNRNSDVRPPARTPSCAAAATEIRLGASMASSNSAPAPEPRRIPSIPPEDGITQGRVPRRATAE
jgi:glyoxylase-like metal-dependent hydrolase (beta-lactamase superfamily II)